MWDLLSTSLFQAKMGMSHFYPYISFSMMCQAFMEQDADASRFGLEVRIVSVSMTSSKID